MQLVRLAVEPEVAGGSSCRAVSLCCSQRRNSGRLSCGGMLSRRLCALCARRMMFFLARRLRWSWMVWPLARVWVRWGIAGLGNLWGLIYMVSGSLGYLKIFMLVQPHQLPAGRFMPDICA